MNEDIVITGLCHKFPVTFAEILNWAQSKVIESTISEIITAGDKKHGGQISMVQYLSYITA